MKPHDGVEELLARTTVPQVIEGPHRTRLKNRILSRTAKEGLTMAQWKRKLAWACVVVFVSIGAVLFLHPGHKALPTFSQLVEASEAAAANINSLRMVGRDSDGKKQRNFQIWAKSPFFIRKDCANGDYTIITYDRYCDYNKTRNTFVERAFDMKSHLALMGLEPDATLASLLTRQSMMAIMENEPDAAVMLLRPSRSIQETVVEEALFKNKPAYKVTCKLRNRDSQPYVLYFDRSSNFLFRIGIEAPGNSLFAEIVEVNPEIDDSVFSMEPPEGATVVYKTEDDPLESGNNE